MSIPILVELSEPAAVLPARGMPANTTVTLYRCGACQEAFAMSVLPPTCPYCRVRFRDVESGSVAVEPGE